MKLKEICEIKNGSTPSTTDKENYDGDIAWITPKDLSMQNSRYIFKGERNITQKGYNSCSTSLFPKGTVLMSSRAPIGLLAIAGTECCTNQGFKNLVVNEKANSEYLYYYLKNRIKEIELLGSGTTFKEVSKTSLEKWEIDIPEIEQQKNIAAILSSLDNKIALNRQLNDNLPTLVRSLTWVVANL
ncbi:hypothetical protein FACS1894123_01420 [Bacteroidia bacterium]|nr:hypothetical protein FACS1894123_01420 [Bacteroidia bacterium]